jgi:hypothetical protein
LTASPLWQRLPVVGDRVFPVSEHWGSGEVTATGLVVDDIVASLEAT